MSAHAYDRALTFFGSALVAMAVLLLASIALHCGGDLDGPRRAHAQESADVPTSAGGAGRGGPVPANGPAVTHTLTAGRIASDEASVLVLAMAMVADGGWNARGDRWDHEMIAHALLTQSQRRGIPIAEQALSYVAAFDARKTGLRSTWVRCLNLQATKPCNWPLAQSWSKHVPLWLGIIEKARAFLADPSSLPNPCPNAYHFGTRDGEDGARAKRAGWPQAVCWAHTRNGVWAINTRRPR